jgi:PKD repeat protein
MKNLTKLNWVLFLLIMVAVTVSCKKKETTLDAIASFTYKVDTIDFKKIHFTSASQNYSALSWDFGDNSAKSTEVNPVHTFPAVGDYVVKLSAAGTNGSSDVCIKKITIVDNNEQLTMLVGDVSKTWKLIRDVSTKRYPLECGPWDHSTIWWAVGNGNDELANRPCMLNDEWTFGRDGSLVYNANGDYWAEGGMFVPDNSCEPTTTMVGPNSEDLSAWGSGNHTFTLTATQITANGLGAFIGFYKLGNLQEVKVPQQYVTYNIIKLTDGAVDTLIIEGQYKWDASDGGYWRFVLVHYDDPSQEPPIPSHQPTASFTVAIDALMVTCTNTSTYGVTYLWDFGDGQTATTKDATHTYSTGGVYKIRLRTTNASGSSSTMQEVFVNATALTESDLIGAAWKVRMDTNSIFVGPALGSNAWYVVPFNFMNGGGTGPDDWSCMMDDEFTFSSGGVYTYATNGSARNDGYFGTPNGCWDDAAIAASGNGAAFGSGTHSFAFTPATATTKAVIDLKNGTTGAAFLGFYKGYYGGENSNSANPPNGGNTANKYYVMGYAKSATKAYLFVTVDISTAHDGSSSWSVILER